MKIKYAENTNKVYITSKFYHITKDSGTELQSLHSSYEKMEAHTENYIKN